MPYRLLITVLALFACLAPAWAEQGQVQKTAVIAQRYGLGSVYESAQPLTDDAIAATVLHAAQSWKVAHTQVAWYAPGKRAGQGVAAVGESIDGATVKIMRPRDEAEALWLEKALGYPTSPAALSNAYLENEVIADDDFQEKTVIFTGTVAEIAKGAFNKPYVFFPNAPDSVTGVTCYFNAKDPMLRSIRKGSTALVRGKVKGFLMQDVILEQCAILSTD